MKHAEHYIIPDNINGCVKGFMFTHKHTFYLFVYIWSTNINY